MEPPGGAHTDHAQAAELLAGVLREKLAEIKRMPVNEMLNARYAKFRNMAQFFQVEG
jgi:acetyl-CoA carboxylase carboxyl transferase subunit alpha